MEREPQSVQHVGLTKLLRELIGLVELPLQYKPPSHDDSGQNNPHHRSEKYAGHDQDAARYHGHE